MTSMYLFPSKLRGRGPTMSIAILLKGSVITGSEIIGAGLTPVFELFWQMTQLLQCSATSLKRVGQ